MSLLQVLEKFLYFSGKIMKYKKKKKKVVEVNNFRTEGGGLIHGILIFFCRLFSRRLLIYGHPQWQSQDFAAGWGV